MTKGFQSINIFLHGSYNDIIEKREIGSYVSVPPKKILG